MPMVTTRISEAVPIIIPSAVSRNLTLLLLKVSKAKLMTSPKQMTGGFRPSVLPTLGEQPIANQMLNAMGRRRNIDWRLELAERSFDLADGNTLVTVGTIQAGLSPSLHNYPIDSIHLLEPLKICRGEVLPAPKRTGLLEPGVGQFRKHRHCPTVFDVIGQPGTLGDVSKPVLIFAGCAHVVGVQSEIGIKRSVVSNPHEGTNPVVARVGTGPFHVRGIWKKLSLHIPHPGAQRKEEEKPAPKSITQNEFRQQSPRKGEEQHVNQVQNAHGLKFCEIRQTWRNRDHQCDQ